MGLKYYFPFSPNWHDTCIMVIIDRKIFNFRLKYTETKKDIDGKFSCITSKSAFTNKSHSILCMSPDAQTELHMGNPHL